MCAVVSVRLLPESSGGLRIPEKVWRFPTFGAPERLIQGKQDQQVRQGALAGWTSSDGMQHALLQQGKPGSSVHRAFNEFELRDKSLDHAVALGDASLLANGQHSLWAPHRLTLAEIGVWACFLPVGRLASGTGLSSGLYLWNVGEPRWRMLPSSPTWLIFWTRPSHRAAQDSGERDLVEQALIPVPAPIPASQECAGTTPPRLSNWRRWLTWCITHYAGQVSLLAPVSRAPPRPSMGASLLASSQSLIWLAYFVRYP